MVFNVRMCKVAITHELEISEKLDKRSPLFLVPHSYLELIIHILLSSVAPYGWTYTCYIFRYPLSIAGLYYLTPIIFMLSSLLFSDEVLVSLVMGLALLVAGLSTFLGLIVKCAWNGENKKRKRLLGKFRG